MSEQQQARLTEIADAMVETLMAHPDASGDERALVILQDGTWGAMNSLGYDETEEVLDDLLVHIKTVFEMQGKRLLILLDEEKP